LPETPDCAIVTVPRSAVEPVVRECAERGISGAVIFASGYAESGLPERRAEQERLSQIARATGLRIVGPNCVGILNYAESLIITFSFGGIGKTDTGMDSAPAQRGAVGIASQSGAMGNAVAQASHLGLPVSHMLTAGNSCDVDVADYVAYLAEDDHCQVIICLFEGLASPQRLIEAGKLAEARGKPLIVCKIASSAAGADSALSHTGVLAGSQAAYAAAFRRMNAVVVDNLEDLAPTAAYFLKTRRQALRKPLRGRVAVLAASGGFCTVGVDKAEQYGVELHPPSERTAQALAKIVPEFGRVGNPCDMTAQNTPDSIRACCDALLAGDEYDALVVPFTFATERHIQRIQGYDEIARRHSKLVNLVWTSAWRGGPGWKEATAGANLSLFSSMDECFRTLAAWQAHEHGRDESVQAEGSPRATLEPQGRAAAAKLLGEHGARRLLTERASKAVLRHYGIPVVEERLARSPDEAVNAAKELGLPVVLKLEVEGLGHKTEAGGVLLDLRDETQVREAYAKLLLAVEQQRLSERFAGVLVQPMIRGGVELIAGARIDPQFGPTVMVGLGGTLVELMKDSVAELAPITQAQASAMLRRLRGYKLLTGLRGAPAVDQAALADALCRLSEFAVDQAQHIQEVDINPLVCSAERVVAVDALVVRR